MGMGTGHGGTLTDCSMLAFCKAKSEEMRVVREERAHGGGRLGRGTGGAHNHVDDGVDGLLHVEVPGRLQAGGGEVAAVGMVRGDDVEPLVLGVGGQSKTCGHSCRMCPGDMLGTGVHWPPWGPASALQHAVCPRAHPQGSCGEHPCCAVPTRWLGEMATENTLIPKCLASLAASSRPPQGSLYPSKGCPSVTTIRYLFSLRWEPLQRFKHRDQRCEGCTDWAGAPSTTDSVPVLGTAPQDARGCPQPPPTTVPPPSAPPPYPMSRRSMPCFMAQSVWVPFPM